MKSILKITASDNSRCWGTVSCIGTAYGKVVVNFNPSDKGQYQTVVVPEMVAEGASNVVFSVANPN